MSSSEDFTLDTLIDRFKKQKECFSDQHVPLSTTQIETIKRVSAFIAQDISTIQRNHLKKRACLILNDLWMHRKETFLLCALTTFPTQLASLDPATSLRDISTWWDNVDHPKGLQWIIENYAEILPGGELVHTKSCLPKKRQRKSTTQNCKI